jgi:anaerobic magnesium-protoporphyrin IX monomethyl ester cyclase
MHSESNTMHSQTDFLFVKAATIFPPIEYAYLAPHVEKLGLKVAILDLVIDGIMEDDFRNILLQRKPRYVGIKCLSFAANLSFSAARIVKETLPECRVIFGGHHVTALPHETLSNLAVDFIVRGEGEYSLSELVNALERNLPLDSIQGIGYKSGSRLVVNGDRPFIENLDELPLPAYHLFDMSKYFGFSAMHGMKIRRERFMPLFTSRGCPYQCIYCHHSEGLKVRAKSPGRVMEEIELLAEKYGIREFHIEDDTFNIDLNRAKEILDRIAALKHKLAIQFPNGLRADRIDEELVDKMKRAGTFLVCIAIETGSERIMKLIKKNLDLSKVKNAVSMLANKRILAWGYFMLGFPTETKEEMRQTVEFARRLRLHFVSFSIVLPFPGTPLWDMIDKKGISYDEYFHNLNYSSPKITLSEVPASEMPGIRKKAMQKFYSVWRMLRIASYITSKDDVKYYWRKFLYRKIGKE